MTSNQPLDLDHLAALAAAATPGPWHLTDSSAIVAPLTADEIADVWEPTAASRNGEFIEAMSPEVAKALVAEVRRRRAQLEDQADADTVADRAARAISNMGAEIRALTSERNRYRNAWHNARSRAADAEDNAKFTEEQQRLAVEESHVVADDSDDPEHVDDCPGCEPAGPDTLAAWLHQRFGTRGRYDQDWDALSDDDRAYWEHQDAAVRRAVARGGFKTTPPAARSAAV